MGSVDNLFSFLLVSFGAIIGSNMRFVIYSRLDQVRYNKKIITLLINSIASFFLGLFYSISIDINNLNYANKLGLFCFVGILGSFSTFSTFIYDLYDLLSQLKFDKALIILVCSLFLGMISLVIGLTVGKL